MPSSHTRKATIPPQDRIRAILLFAASLLVGTATAQADFTLAGTLPELEPRSSLTLLRENLDTKQPTQAGAIAVRAGGAFEASFSGEAGLFNLVLDTTRKLPLAIADGQRLFIAADATRPLGYAVTGSPDTEILHAYEAFRKESLERLVYPPRTELNEVTAAGGASPERLATLAQQEVDGYSAHRKELNDFTIEKAGSSIALYATSLRWDGDYRLEELQQQVAAFAAKHPTLAITRSMQERLRLFSLTAIGAVGASLSGKDLDGTPHSLGEMKGKVVLVDFWASWCVPCRVENRHYQKLLQAYGPQGFEILAVNLDDSRSVWAMASRQDGVRWPQISDLLGWDSPLAAAYNVTALPVSFLLDEERRILARNLRGVELAAKLEELFGDSGNP